MPISVQRKNQSNLIASSRHLSTADHADIVKNNRGVMSANAACQLPTNAKFSIGQKQNVHCLANAAQCCMCFMATVGCQQGDNVATKVLPMFANNQCLLGNCRPLIYIIVLSINAPPQSTVNRSYSAKPIYEIAQHRLPTSKEFAMIPY